MTGLAEEFFRRYGRQPRLFRAPGRVNLIGEHTDYNGGFVLPAAIDLSTYVAAAPREDGRLRAASLTVPGELDSPWDELRPSGTWTDYVAGVAVLLEARGGADLLIGSEVPLGGGLSSSAALEVAAALALGTGSRTRVELALLCQRAENEFAGMRCGIMDPFAICLGVAGHALRIDCRDLSYETVPIPGSVRLVIANTMVKHELAASAYNERRAACESAAAKLGVRFLGDLGESGLRTELLTESESRCARHVVSENARVLRFVEALRSGNLPAAGTLMAESQRSLRNDFGVSCEELDTMVSLAGRLPGVHGARMTGGGFGGCTINLVAEEAVGAVTESLSAGYEAATGIRPEIYVCQAGAGAEEVLG